MKYGCLNEVPFLNTYIHTSGYIHLITFINTYSRFKYNTKNGIVISEKPSPRKQPKPKQLLVILKSETFIKFTLRRHFISV